MLLAASAADTAHSKPYTVYAHRIEQQLQVLVDAFPQFARWTAHRLESARSL